MLHDLDETIDQLNTNLVPINCKNLTNGVATGRHGGSVPYSSRDQSWDCPKPSRIFLGRGVRQYVRREGARVESA